MKKITGFVLCGMLAVVMAGCGQTVKRVDENTITDYSGGWNDTDSQMVAEEMIHEALGMPWLSNFMKQNGRNPRVIVGTVINKTDEHITVDVFQNQIERTLTNSDKVTFVTGKGERNEVRAERTDQQDYSSNETKKAFKKELAADYMMQGTISTVVDQKEGAKAVFYQVDMVLVDMESNTKVWYGQKRIKKIISKSSLGF